MKHIRLFEDYLFEFNNKTVEFLLTKFKKENPGLTDPIIKSYLDRFEQKKSSPLIVEKDIMKYSFKELEHMLDSKFPIISNKKSKISVNDAIYNKDGIELYRADTRQQAIDLGRGYPWCISADSEGNMFNTYRFNEESYETIYFLFNRNLNRDDLKYCMIILVDKNGKYSLADKTNDGDLSGMTHFTKKEMYKINPAISRVSSLILNYPPTATEIQNYNKTKNLTHNESLLNYLGSEDLVTDYIRNKHRLSDKQFDNLPVKLKNLYLEIGPYISDEQWEYGKKNKRIVKYILDSIGNSNWYRLIGNFDNGWEIIGDTKELELEKMGTIGDRFTTEESIKQIKKIFKDLNVTFRGITDLSATDLEQKIKYGSILDKELVNRLDSQQMDMYIENLIHIMSKSATYEKKQDGTYDIETKDVFDVSRLRINNRTLKIKSLDILPFKINSITCDTFDASFITELENLNNFPRIVNGSFNIKYTGIENLTNGPEIVTGRYIASNLKKLSSIIGLPKSVDSLFLEYNNELKTLEGCSESIRNELIVHSENLISLKGAPTKWGLNSKFIFGVPEKNGNITYLNTSTIKMSGISKIKLEEIRDKSENINTKKLINTLIEYYKDLKIF
jgi:hypothetical protein